MSTEQLIRLAERADHVTGRADDRLAEVHSRIRTHRRRRTAGAVAGAGALVLAIVAGATLLGGSPERAPDPAPRPDRVDPAPPESVRPLTWTDEFWPSRRISYGDRVIDTRLALTEYDFASMDLTDDGVVVTTVDGRVWLADTSSVERIAATQVSHRFLATLDVRTGNAGSLAAWIDDRALVVYDTAARQVVVRHRCDPGYCQILWVGRDRVYAEDRRDGRVLRIDAAQDRVTTVSARALATEMLRQPRALVLGDSFDDGQVSDGVDTLFVRQDERLWAAPESAGNGTAATFDTTGSPIRLRVPEGYDRARSFTLFQWIDDDRVALMAGAGGMGFVPGLDPEQPEDGTGYGDIMVCRLSTELCRLAVTGPRVHGDLDGDGIADRLRIVPHYGTPGTN